MKWDQTRNKSWLCKNVVTWRSLLHYNSYCICAFNNFKMFLCGKLFSLDFIEVWYWGPWLISWSTCYRSMEKTGKASTLGSSAEIRVILFRISTVKSYRGRIGSCCLTIKLYWNVLRNFPGDPVVQWKTALPLQGAQIWSILGN